MDDARNRDVIVLTRPFDRRLQGEKSLEVLTEFRLKLLEV